MYSYPYSYHPYSDCDKCTRCGANHEGFTSEADKEKRCADIAAKHHCKPSDANLTGTDYDNLSAACRSYITNCAGGAAVVETKPVVQTPVVQTPVVQTPVVQTPVVQTPVTSTTTPTSTTIDGISVSLSDNCQRVKKQYDCKTSDANLSGDDWTNLKSQCRAYVNDCLHGGSGGPGYHSDDSDVSSDTDTAGSSTDDATATDPTEDPSCVFTKDALGAMHEDEKCSNYKRCCPEASYASNQLWFYPVIIIAVAIGILILFLLMRWGLRKRGKSDFEHKGVEREMATVDESGGGSGSGHEELEQSNQ